MKVEALGFTGFRVLAQAINTAMKKAIRVLGTMVMATYCDKTAWISTTIYRYQHYHCHCHRQHEHVQHQRRQITFVISSCSAVASSSALSFVLWGLLHRKRHIFMLIRLSISFAITNCAIMSISGLLRSPTSALSHSPSSPSYVASL